MSNPVQLDDIAGRWRPLTPEERITTHALLDDAWSLLTGRLPGLEADLAADRVSRGNVVRVVCAMVVRVLRNPDGLFEEETDGYRYRRDQATSTGQLLVTDDELGDLTPGSLGPRNALSVGVRTVPYGVAFP